jgi:hypothetical protein
MHWVVGDNSRMNASDMLKLDLSEYRTRVEHAASESDGSILYNGSAAHAQIIVETLFRRAKSTASVLSGGMNNLVYGHPDTISAVELFVQRGGKIDAIVDGPIDGGSEEENIFIRTFQNVDRVTIKRVNKDQLHTFEYHLFVADDDKFRFEPHKADKAAIAVFGDTALATTLLKLFRRLWTKAQPLAN